MEHNPYASPRLPLQAQLVPEVAAPLAGLWRKGNLLVMHRDAPLPYICIKSGMPADGTLPRKLSWHHPALFIVAVLSLLIYVILALILTKRARIQIGLSEPVFARRRRDIIIAWSLVLLSILVTLAGISILEQHPLAPLAIILGILLFFIGAIYGLIRARLVSPDRIQGDYIWLKGVHPDVLAPLPPWPYQP